MVEVCRPQDRRLASLLADHPQVTFADCDSPAGVLRFRAGEALREVRAGDADCELKGLVELMDNNPIVCADSMSVPGPFSTLALIALGPLIWAGLVVEDPALVCNGPADEEDLLAFLATAGWSGGLTLTCGEEEGGDLLVACAMAKIDTPEDFGNIEELYEERFGRSFYVHSDFGRRDPTGTPFASYSLRFSQGEEHSLVSIDVAADREGKCGAAQMVHAFNVMAGFEESLGIGG